MTIKNPWQIVTGFFVTFNPMTKGVVLLAFGKPSYSRMAVHMAASIKYYNADLPITVCCDSYALQSLNNPKYSQFFDSFQLIDKEYLTVHGKFSPGKAKLSMSKFLPYDVNLYLDVDGIAIKDVTPLLDTDKDFASIVVGTGGQKDDIEYLFWTDNERAWNHFQLDESTTYRSLQSSAMLFRKSELMDTLTEAIDRYIDFPLSDLTNQWGGTLPDELIYSGVCAKLGYDPSFDQGVVFFGHHNKLSLNEVTEKYYINSIYGGGNLVKDTWKDWYDRHAVKVMRHFKMEVLGTVNLLSRQKHVAK